MPPPITHPLGKHWEQPPLRDVWFFGGLAIMTEKTLEELPEYSSTLPSGVYDGKMWRANVTPPAAPGCALPPREKPRKEEWILRWFAPSDEPNKCAVKWADIVLIDLSDKDGE